MQIAVRVSVVPVLFKIFTVSGEERGRRTQHFSADENDK